VERFISKSGHLERGNTGNMSISAQELTILRVRVIDQELYL